MGFCICICFLCLLGCFPFCFWLGIVCLLFVSNLFSYLIIFYFYTLESCLFYNDTKKGVDPDRRNTGEEMGGVEGRK